MNTTLLQPPAVGDSLGPLAGRLAAADRVLQRERGGVRFLRAWPWVVGFVLGCFVLDVVLHLPAGLRAGLSVAGVVLAVSFTAWCAWIAFLRRNSFVHTARVLENRHARLGSKLMNIFQLREQMTDPAVQALTRDMAALAVKGYAQELANEPIEQLAHTDALRQEARRTGYGVLAFIAVLALGFDVTRTEVPRFLDPYGDHPPYSFTRLDISEPGADGVQVVYGESLLVTVKTSGHRPGELWLSYFPEGHPEQTVTMPMFDKGARGFTQQIEGIRTNLVLTAHTKNRHAVSRQRRVDVVLTPRLEAAFVKITPPSYTGLPAEERPFNFKNLKALIGSQIAFRLQSNRPLSGGALTVSTEDGTIVPLEMTPSGEKEVSGTIEAKQPGMLTFSLMDRDGFASQETWQSTLTVTHDLPPEVQISNPGEDTFVAMDFKAAPVVEASDDYGLKTLRIHTARNGAYGEPRIVPFEKPPLHARELQSLDFTGLESGDTVSIFAEVIDNAPDPHIVRSKTVTLTVITTEEYNDFLREQTDMSDIEAKYSKLAEDFREFVDQQKKLAEEIDAMKKLLDAAKTDAEKTALQRKLDELLARQHELNAKLNKLADRMDTFVRDQPVYDFESELQDTLSEKADEIRNSTAKNEEQMKALEGAQPPDDQKQANANQQNSDGSQSPFGNPGQDGKAQPAGGGQQPPSQKMLADFKQAAQDQLERLGATEQEIAQEVEQPLEDLSLLHEIIKDINRFKDLYAAQEELAKQSKAYDKAGPLSREDQLALKDLAAAEKMIGDELDAVEQKLWEDGKAAEEKFPKAGSSAKEIADAMGDLKLQTLANQTTREMLAGNGDKGADLAENLRSEMEKLFSKCQSQGTGPISSELDQYMSIQGKVPGKRTFQQMMQTKKFGAGRGFKSGRGQMGNGGRDGQAVYTGQNAKVMGNESRVSNSERAKLNGNGRNQATPNGALAPVALDKTDVVNGINAVNRESAAVQGETTIEQYSDIVEKYFKAITKPADKTPSGKKP
jgi:hypothetical protein